MAAGRVKGITIEIGGDTTKLETALKNVNREIKTTESKLKDVDKLLKMDPGNTNLLNQKYKTLQTDIGATKEKLDTLKEAAKQADQALADGTISQNQYDALQREIVETEQDLKNLEQEYKNFGSVQAQQVAAAGEKMKEFGGKVESAGKGLTTHVTLPLAAVGAAGAASFAEVDKTMQLTNKTMNNTSEEAEMLNKAMKSAAANSTYGMKDAANATLNFARAGLDAKQASAALAPAMNLAAGEGGNLDTVSAGLVATINGFHGSFDDAGKYADVFAAACNNSALDVDSLSHAMSVAAPIFSSAGYSVNDAALYMGVMANNGIDADKAANSLKTGLARLVSPAKEGAEMMDKLGISVTNSDGTMKSSIQIQKELHDAFGKLSESEQIAAASAIFGKNQMAPWLALINTAPEDVGELDQSLKNCAGTTDEMAQAMMSGFGGSLEKLKSSIDVLVTSIGEALAPTIQKVASFIQKLVDKFNALTPAQQQVIVKIGLIVAAVGPLLIIIGKLLTAVGTIMTFAPKIVSGVQSVIGIGSKLAGGLKVLWGVLAANPITLIVAAIAAAVAAFIYFWNTSEGFRQFWIGLWEAIKGAVQTVVDAIVTFFTVTIPEAFSGFAAFLKGLWEGISTLFSTVWNGIKTTVTGVLTAIGEAIVSKWTAISTTASTLLEGLKQVFSVAWEAIKLVVTTALEGIQEAVSTVWNAIVSFLTPLLNGIKTLFQTIWNGISTVISTALNAIQGVIQRVWNGISSFISGILNTIKNVVSTGWNAVKTTVTNILNGIHSAVISIWNKMKSGVSSAIGQIGSTIRSGFTTAINFIKGIVTQAYGWGRDLVMGIVNGIKSAIGTLGDAVSSVASKISGFLHFSVPDEGPLSEYESWMPDFMKGLARGIERSRSLVQKAVSDVAGDMVVNPRAAFAGADFSGMTASNKSSQSMITPVLDAISSLASKDVGDTIIPVYIGQDRIDEIVVTAAQRANYRSGGR